MDNNVNELEMIRSVLSSMHIVARKNPELLDVLLTDEVLRWAMDDIALKLQIYLGYYVSQQERSLLPFKYESDKSLNASLIELNGRELLDYYKLYKTYEELRLKRNVEVTRIGDIDIVEDALIKGGLLKQVVPKL